MIKTLNIGFSGKHGKVTIESTSKKLHGTAVWIDKSTGNYYYVERYTRLGRTIESAKPYNLTKEEFEKL